MYSKLIKKAGAALMSAALAVNGVAVGAMNVISSSAADAISVEFEDAAFTGDVTVESGNGASGGSYLKMTESGTITVTFTVEAAGSYNLVFYAGGIGSAKQQSLSLNGTPLDTLAIPESTGFEKIVLQGVNLKAGENALTISKSWGWSNFDKMEVVPFEFPEIKATQAVPCDPEATAEAKSLMAYLNGVYGNNIISGQQEIYSSGHGGNFEYEFDYLKDLTGKLPAVRGFDYLNEANILYGSEDGTTDRIIDWVKNKNGIATASWHLTVPKNFANYNVGDKIQWGDATYSCEWDSNKTKNTATDFNTANVLVEGTKENEYYMTCLGELAKRLEKLQDEGVPLIFRPLHEAEGGGGETGSWFWWGADGSATYKDIWKLTYTTLTEKYGLHNLVWEWNSYNFDTSVNWYPGDEYVDIIGFDKYSCTKYLAENNWQPKVVHDDSAYASTFYGIMDKYESTKLVAMAENDSFSTVENLTNDKAGWLYFCTWYDGGSDNINFLSGKDFNTKEDTIAMYQSDYCITLDELPADLYSTDSSGVTTSSRVTTTTTTTTVVTTTHEDDPDKDFADVTVNKEGNIIIKFNKPSDEVYLRIDLPEGITYANGGLGVTIPLNGVYYWANVQWEAKKSGDVKINLADNLLNVTEGTTEVEDEAVIKAAKEMLSTLTEFQGQIWYASDAAGKEAKKDGIQIAAAYTMSGSSDVSSTTETTTTTTTTETSSTTSSIITDLTPEYGDANCDSEVNMADAVFIMQSIANPDKYKLTEIGALNADVDESGDITNKDALIIQQYKLGLIKVLPYISTGE